MEQPLTHSVTQSIPAAIFTRRYKAAPEKVWRAWTDPHALAQWFGPDDAGVVSLADMDVRVGGRYHIRFVLPGDEEHNISGVYQEVVPNGGAAPGTSWTASRLRRPFFFNHRRPLTGRSFHQRSKACWQTRT